MLGKTKKNVLIVFPDTKSISIELGCIGGADPEQSQVRSSKGDKIHRRQSRIVNHNVIQD